MKSYIREPQFRSFRARYQECIRMLNGLERTLEKELDESQRRWPDAQKPEP